MIRNELQNNFDTKLNKKFADIKILLIGIAIATIISIISIIVISYLSPITGAIITSILGLIGFISAIINYVILIKTT